MPTNTDTQTEGQAKPDAEAEAEAKTENNADADIVINSSTSVHADTDVNADAEGEGIKGDCNSTVLGCFPVAFGYILEQFVGIFVIVLPFGQFEVLDESHGVEVHENGH